MAARTDSDFEALLEFLKTERGFDFTGYKRTGLERRVRKRMASVAIDSYVDYRRRLEDNPEEFALLFDAVLINVTQFFRDGVAWEVIAKEVIPAIIARKGADETIRIWSAGCATGEEAYSLCILLAEALGEAEFIARVKMYATDVDADALNKARAAVYPESAVAEIPPEFVTKYFEPVDGRYAFRKDLRRAVIFGRNDLVRDAPISKVDMLLCRNTLMYFNAETQARILSRFYFAIEEQGFLILGKAETLLSHTHWFTPVELKHRIFRKLRRAAMRDRMAVISELTSQAPVRTVGPRLREAAFTTGPVAQILIGRDGSLNAANERARVLFGLSGADIGKPVQDFQFSYRPVELRSLVDQVYGARRAHTVKEVQWAPDADLWYDVHLLPLYGPDNVPLGVAVSFEDVSEFHRLRLELEHSHQELEAAYEELQSTNEELETTNEELQSTIEELETTNEEMQATNEELETMNEELQTTNEELQVLNDELRRGGESLNLANEFLESVLSSFDGSVIVVNPALEVLAWNAHSEDAWGLRTAEVLDTSLMALDIGLPVHQLRPSLKKVLEGKTARVETEVEAVNRRGRQVKCIVTISPLTGNSRKKKAISGALLLIQVLNGNNNGGNNRK